MLTYADVCIPAYGARERAEQLLIPYLCVRVRLCECGDVRGCHSIDPREIFLEFFVFFFFFFIFSFFFVFLPRKHRLADVGDVPQERAVSIRQHTSAYVSIRQHTSAYLADVGDVPEERAVAETGALPLLREREGTDNTRGVAER
jgi:hypothetical protein